MICFLDTHAEPVAASSLEMGAAIGLIALLVAKELCDASGSSRVRTLGRHLDIAVVPLLIVFAVTLMTKMTRIIEESV